jgi:hypothetical protein
MARSIDKDIEFLTTNNLSFPSKLVRLEICYYFFEIQPLTTNSCRIRAVTNIDPKVALVPKSILAYMARKVTQNLNLKFISLLFNFSKKYPNTPRYLKQPHGIKNIKRILTSIIGLREG